LTPFSAAACWCIFAYAGLFLKLNSACAIAAFISASLASILNKQDETKWKRRRRRNEKGKKEGRGKRGKENFSCKFLTNHRRAAHSVNAISKQTNSNLVIFY